MKYLRWVLLVVVLAAMTGCGVRTLYGNLDWFAMRAVDDLVTLDDTQRMEVRMQVENRLGWHCATQLPDYATLLRKMEADLEAGRVGTEILRGYGKELFGFWQAMQWNLPEDTMGVLTSLTDDQAEELLESIDERNRDIREELESSTEDEQALDRARGMERQLRRFFGRLHRDQKALVVRWSRSLKPSAELNLDMREAWAVEFAEALERRGQAEIFKQDLEELFLRTTDDWSSAYREVMEHNRERTLELFTDLYESAADRQRNRLAGRISRLADDFERLACADLPADQPPRQ